jgi:hypothetical protein
MVWLWRKRLTSTASLDNPALFVRDAVKLVHEVIDLRVGRGDFAFQTLEFRRRELA